MNCHLTLKAQQKHRQQNLFITLSDNANKLLEDKAQLFHDIVAKLIYMSIATNWTLYKKLACMMQYIRGR